MKWTKRKGTTYTLALQKPNGTKIKTWRKLKKPKKKILTRHNHLRAGKAYMVNVKACKKKKCSKWKKKKFKTRKVPSVEVIDTKKEDAVEETPVVEKDTNESAPAAEKPATTPTIETPVDSFIPLPEITEPEPTTVYECSYDAYNCSSFSTWTEAQKAHDYCIEQVDKDIHRLDYNKDGVACEGLQ